jgi:Neuraminidase (sialidase)
VQTPTALLAFVEGRPGIPYCSGTFYPTTPDFPILLRTSRDAGATWSAELEITRGNLDFLVAVYDPRTARTLLLVQLGDTGTIQTTSADDGATWSAPVPVTIAAPPGVYAALIPGVGHGLVVSPAHCLDATCGGTAGRLVLPFVATLVGPVSNDTACGTCASALVYSDDGGATWTLGAVSDQNGSREAALAQLDSAAHAALAGVVLASERNLGNATGVRLRAVSVDGGRGFSSEGVDAGLPDVRLFARGAARPEWRLRILRPRHPPYPSPFRRSLRETGRASSPA